MAIVEKLEVEISAKNNIKTWLNQARDDIKWFTERSKSETAIELSINSAKIKQQLDEVRSQIKQAKTNWDFNAEVALTANAKILQNSLTQADRELRNFLRTWEKDISVLWNLFNNVTGSIDRMRTELLQAWKSTTAIDNLKKKAEEVKTSFDNWKISVEKYWKELKNIELQANNTSSFLWWLWKAFIWLFAIDTLKNWIFWVIELARQAEKTQVAFTNLTWSAKEATEILSLIREFANKTPFEFPELADVSRKLMSIAWITKTELIPTLTALWDIASSQWKSISQVVEAYNDAIVWEFERLKEFWIRAQVSGDKIKLTFKWQTVEINKTQEAIDWYIRSIAQAEWVAWSMSTQSQTLDWKISSLNDSWWTLWVTIWTEALPALKSTVDVLSITIWALLSIWKVLLWVWKILVGSFVTSLVAVWEVIGKTIWYISVNFNSLWKNIGIITEYIINNFAIIAWNIPAIFGAWLDEITKKLNVWWNETIDFINSIWEKIWVPKIWKINIETNLWWWMSELKSMWELEQIQPFWDLKLTTKSFWMLTNEIDKVYKAFEKVEKVPPITDIIPLPIIKDQIITLDSLNKKLQEYKKELWSAEIWSKSFKDLQNKIKQTQKQIDKYTWLGWKSNTITQAEKEAEYYKKEDEKLFNQKIKQEEELKKLQIKQEEEKQDSYKKTYDILKDTYSKAEEIIQETISKNEENINKFNDEIDNLKDNIKDLDTKLSDLWKEKATTLWERNLELLKEEVNIQKELSELKKEEKTNSNLQKEIDLNNQLTKITNEKLLIQWEITKWNITQTQLDEVKRVSELSPTAKYLEDFAIKQKEIEDDKLIIENKINSLTSQKEIEEAILDKFNEAKIRLDVNYAIKADEIESSITDKVIEETNKRMSALELLRQKAIETANAMRNAWVNTITEQANTLSWITWPNISQWQLLNSNSSTDNSQITVNLWWVVLKTATDIKWFADTLANTIKNAIDKNIQ